MEFESIKKIVEAEQEADRIIDEAKRKAKTLLEQVEKTKVSNNLYFKSQLDTKQKDLEKEQEEANRQKITSIKAAITEKVQKIREIPQEKMEEAIERIFSKVVKL